MNDKQPKDNENSQAGYSNGRKQQNYGFHFDLISNVLFFRMSINAILVFKKRPPVVFLMHFSFKFCSLTMAKTHTCPKGGD